MQSSAKLGKTDFFQSALGFMTPDIAQAVTRELKSCGCSGGDVLEIRLRLGGRSSILLTCGTRALSFEADEGDMGAVLERLTGGALYAHRDTLIEGYINPSPGLRVGVCGRARYDGGVPVGISEIRSLIFRISHAECDFEDELYGIWRARGEGGMLIYSPPCGGKTTAIRRLAAMIGREGVRVCAVDERCEFVPEEYKECEVDILRGYKKAKGIEIAVRTLGAQVVVIDEIGADETRSVMSALTLGVPIIATVHARDAQEIFSRPVFKPFLDAGAFGTLVGIKRSGGRRRVDAVSAHSRREECEKESGGDVMP